MQENDQALWYKALSLIISAGIAGGGLYLANDYFSVLSDVASESNAPSSSFLSVIGTVAGAVLLYRLVCNLLIPNSK